MQKLLDYDEWRNFLKVIDKAKLACLKSGHNTSDHFVDVNKMVNLGSGSERQVDDIMLTRYARVILNNPHRTKKFSPETIKQSKIVQNWQDLYLYVTFGVC